MNGNNVILDTNIVLYFLNGDQTLSPLFEENILYLSFINFPVISADKDLHKVKEANVIFYER